MAKSAPVNFEQEIAKLETIVEKMEAGQLSLEDAMSQFEQGVALTKTCYQTLQAAEQKVQILLEKNGEPQLAPFAEAGEHD